MAEYNLEKNIWTEEDFDTMTWHDNPVHGISFSTEFELLLDIDYIFEWVLKGNKYKFWISSCTLIFENVHDLMFDIGPSGTRLTIDNITRENPRKPPNGDYINRQTEFDWIIELHEGEIGFKSVSFKQYVRSAPKLLATQEILTSERGGISFMRT